MDKKLLKDGFVQTDNWHLLNGTDSIDLCALGASPCLVSPAQWQLGREVFTQRPTELNGLIIQTNQALESIAKDLDKIAVIAIHFNAFSDGRGFSLARELREQWGFNGEIRATGDIFLDQLFFMQRCGFNGFSLPKPADYELAPDFLSTFSKPYQAAQDHSQPLWHR